MRRRFKASYLHSGCAAARILSYLADGDKKGRRMLNCRNVCGKSADRRECTKWNTGVQGD